MRRSSRLFEVIQLLRGARGPMTAQAVATALEVNKRTIYRDIASLQAMRVPIVGEAGIGYVMRPGYDLPPLMFSADEMEAVVVGLSLLGRTGDTGLQAAASRVTAKLAAVLPNTATRLDEVPLHVSPWTAVPSPGVDTALLRDAIRDEETLHVTYRDEADRRSSRNVRPIALVYYVDSTVLAAWCELREDFRHFRVDRIEACSRAASQFKGEGRRLRAQWAARTSLFGAAPGRAPG